MNRTGLHNSINQPRGSIRPSEVRQVNNDEIRRLKRQIGQGEGLHLEFKAKANHPDKIAREITAFANTKGGTLLLGVDDLGKLLGVKYPEEDALSIKRWLKRCRPQLKWNQSFIPISSSKWIVSFEIKEGKKKPVFFKESNGIEKVYFRLKDQCLQASIVMTEVMKKKFSNQGLLFNFGDHEKRIINLFEKNKSLTLDQISMFAELQRSLVVRKLSDLVVTNILEIHPGQKEDLFQLNL